VATNCNRNPIKKKKKKKKTKTGERGGEERKVGGKNEGEHG